MKGGAALLEVLRIVLAALAQAGLAFKAGERNAQDKQRKADQEAANDAAQVRNDSGNGDRDSLIDELRKKGRLRDD